MLTVSGIVYFNGDLRSSLTENISAHRNLVLQNVKSHVVSETVRWKANRLRVLQDQKVLPEIQKVLAVIKVLVGFKGEYT